MSKMITAAVIGTGARGRIGYGARMLRFPEDIKVVAAADLNKETLGSMAQEHNIPADKCFNSAEEFLAQPKMSDIVFVCTQDRDHFGHVIPALEKGYDVIVEKPISPSLSECKKIAETANRLGRKVIVCHVLRYTPFYSKLKEILDSGVIGNIMTVSAEEGVGYWHQAHSFVRGNWRNSDESSPMILAKCCHDMDILLWLTGKKCLKVSSFGHLTHFKPENAPKGAADRCLECDKAIREACPYEVEKFYIDGPKGLKNGLYGWSRKITKVEPTIENTMEALRTGPYGRCVYKCDNNVVDHQIVNMQLEDDVTASFTMSAFSNTVRRTIQIRGCFGEIYGDMEASIIKVTEFGKEPVEYDVSALVTEKAGHSGGDTGLVKSIIELFGKGVQSNKISYIDKSIESHFVALAAEESRVNGGMLIDMDEWMNKF